MGKKKKAECGQEVKKQCGVSIELDVTDEIDQYSYHDAQTFFYFKCELDDGHKDMHRTTISEQQIFWVK